MMNMVTEFEEETYSKIVFILLAILVVIMFIFILDIMTGGRLFQSMLCMIVWYVPVVGPQLPGYLECYAIPL